MKMTKSKVAAWLVLLLIGQKAFSAAIPSGSRHDARNQSVVYNPDNTTVIYSASGYITTLVFDEDEKVIEAKPGFEQGWGVKKSENRIYIQIKPVTQMVEHTNEKGESEAKQIAFDPESDLARWRTNLFVVTTKRNYSLELNARSFTQPEKISYVVNYRYPQERKKKQEELEQKRMAEYQRQQEAKEINRSLENAKVPRNWKYYQRVAKGSEYIVPDYAYDDGRFTYFGFNPTKKIPSVFLQFGEQETIVNPTIEQKGNYTVVVVHQLSDKWVLRLGSQVVGIENKGLGQIHLPASQTVSPEVNKEVIE